MTHTSKSPIINSYSIIVIISLFIGCCFNTSFAERSVKVTLIRKNTSYDGSNYSSKQVYPKVYEGSSLTQFINGSDTDIINAIKILDNEDDPNSAGATYKLGAPTYNNIIWSYIVMSPNFWSSNRVVNNGKAKLVFSLNVPENESWNIKAIELDAINYDSYYATKTAGYYGYADKGKVKVNGHELNILDTPERQDIRIDLEPEERQVSEIIIEAEPHAAFGVKGVTLYLNDGDGVPNFIEYETSDSTNPDGTTPRYNFEGKYEIPYVPFGSVHPNLLSCTIFDSTGQQMNVNALYSNDYRNCFTITPNNNEGKGDLLEEGVYRAVFYVNDGFYQPIPEDGGEFSVLPTVEGLMLNWHNVDFTQNPCSVPSHTTRTDSNGNVIQHDWEHVLLNGLRPNTTVYWKVIDTGANYRNGECSSNSIAKVAPTTIPSDYQKLENLSVDLSKGNQLNLILRRNGINSNPYIINYTKNDVATIIESINEESAVIQTKYYNLEGHQISESNNNDIVVKVDVMKDGTTKTKKIFCK